MNEQAIMITPRQSMAARAMVGVTQEEISQKANLGPNTLRRWEKGYTVTNVETMARIVAAYRSYGVEFPDSITVRYPGASPQAKAA
jgi:transcriptional regulator with XRE-family HTH domain